MTQLNRALQEQIVAAIRAGAFPHVAAQCFGVSRRRFDGWRKRGRSKTSSPEFRSFAEAVDEAIAQARLRAEMSIFTDQPRIWLQHGPGRETPRDPGWTTAVKPSAKVGDQRNPLMMPEIVAIGHDLMNAFFANEPAREQIARIFGMATEANSN